VSVSDAAAGHRVVLLARSGPARAALHDAVLAAGARIVLEEDPAALDGETISAAAPTAVLVALEPAIEDAMERLAPVLEAPGITLIFDDAEVAAGRAGWDAQRQVRHLSAKLNGHADVLPPGHDEQGDAIPAPGLPVTPQQRHAGAVIGPYLDEAGLLADALPADGLLAAPLPSPMHAQAPDAVLDVLPWETTTNTPSADEPAADPLSSGAPGTGPDAAGRASFPEASAAAPFVPPPSSWALVDEPTESEVRASAPAVVVPDISIEGLSLIDPEADAIDGAVLVLAGIGGPDAVRKLLAALPSDFPRPVLVQLRLDGGRYDNLVKQLARVSQLPVELACPGQMLLPATVHVLPDGVGLVVDGRALRFAEAAGGDVIDALPPGDSAVLMLSGSDSARVDRALALAAEGGWVAGQSLEGCYDPAASRLLAGRNLPLAAPAELALSLTERWS
jgi:chemosensory pili system protein ChpB (putative protein-glutamate methylesterase)